MVAPKQPKVGASTNTSPATPAQEPAPGKRTLVEVCYENGPDPALLRLLEQFRDRPPSLLDDLLPRDPEVAKRRIAEGMARAKEVIIGELPLGGWLVGTRAEFQKAVRSDEAEIASRTIEAARSTVSGAVAVAAGTARGESSILIMRRGEAAAAVEQAVTAMAPNPHSVEPGGSRTSARGARLEPEAHRSTAQPEPPSARTEPPARATPPAPPQPEVPVHSELPRIDLRPQTRPSRGPATPIKPGVLVPKSQRQPRDKTLVDDLKLRSVPTLRNGEPNPAFDPFTPSFIGGHFKSEQRRTGSDDPRDWRNPKGYEAQHPNGRPWAKYGEPPGTTLTWGTIHDNRALQKPREFNQKMNAKPKPLP